MTAQKPNMPYDGKMKLDYFFLPAFSFSINLLCRFALLIQIFVLILFKISLFLVDLFWSFVSYKGHTYTETLSQLDEDRERSNK